MKIDGVIPTHQLQVIFFPVANPYMEIFNVASSLTGTYPFETDSLEERKRLSIM